MSNDFSNKQSQEKTFRTVEEFLVPLDSVMTYDTYGIFNAIDFKMDGRYLYIQDLPAQLKLFIVDKETLELADSLVIPEGEGPGELTSLMGYDISNEFIAVSDEDFAKAQIWSKTGDLVNEFLLDDIYPERVSVWDDGTVTFLSSKSINTGSILFTLDQEGKILHSFGDVSGEEFNPVRFGGSILADHGYFYFAGSTEHVLAKWDREGVLQYSVKTIEDVPSEINYSSSINPSYSVFRIPPHAIYSAVSSMIYNDLWLIVYGDDRTVDPYIQLIDIYDKNSGQYLVSFQIPQPWAARSISVDDDYIYMLQRLENGDNYLFRYENNLEEIMDASMLTE